MSETLRALAGQIEAIERDLGSGGLSPHRLETLAGLAELLSAWNQRMNLTGHRSAEEIVAGLIAEAMALSRELPADARTFTDLGSGAGFPGLPLAILRPEAQFVLVEARERRVHFQRAAIRALDLGNVIPLTGRAEELEPRVSAVITAQAVASPERVLELARPWAEPGGLLAIPSSERVAAETLRSTDSSSDVAVSATAPPRATWKLQRYRVPGRPEDRALLMHRFS